LSGSSCPWRFTHTSVLSPALKVAGIDSEIALVSGKDAGTLNPKFVSFTQFDHNVVVVPQATGHQIVLDPTVSYAPFGFMPWKDSGAGALILNAGQGELGVLPVKNELSTSKYRITVKPRTDYRLAGWIKTENLRKAGSAFGALLNVHELQDPQRGGTKALIGDNDWTQVQLNFNSGALTELTINCLFGGWGRALGTAWFDDIELTIAPVAELAGEVGRVVRLVTTHYAQRGPVESIVPILAALKSSSTTLAMPVLDGLVSGWPEGKAPTIGASER
jgi:hypothetical protein